MLHLACHYMKGPESAKTIATKEDISYQLCCKLMQKLNKAGLVQSCMGVKGGFELTREPAKINLLEIVETIQGPLSVNRCVLKEGVCGNQSNCPVNHSFSELQGLMKGNLRETTLQDLIEEA